MVIKDEYISETNL